MKAIQAIERLLEYVLANRILAQEDLIYARNALLYALRMDAPEEIEPSGEPLPPTATPMLEVLCEVAKEKGIIEDIPFYCDQFAAHLMNLLTPPPSSITHSFHQIKLQEGIQAATDWFYNLCCKNDYIRVDQIARNVGFSEESPYGDLEITINLSKPEKDPREIARQKKLPSVGYPKCMICIENEGYAGRPGYPSHESMRTIPVNLKNEGWRFQYSPYAYYPEHCIVLNEQHTPMSISRRTFELLLSFVAQFPHYFIGSNADLPIVGGSILSHDHFQGGSHVFPMDRAPIYAKFSHPEYSDVEIGAVQWPMTCLRLIGNNTARLSSLAEKILQTWREYDDEELDILHFSSEAHNTITPIARRLSDGRYALQLVFRNNRTTAEHPLGIFHPHEDLHHIKFENIGLIEVMGLFILPGRLQKELNAFLPALMGEPMQQPAEHDPLSRHYAWIQDVIKTHGTASTEATAQKLLQKAVGEKCIRVLEDGGVFKDTEDGRAGFAQFLQTVGIVQREVLCSC